MFIKLLFSLLPLLWTPPQVRIPGPGGNSGSTGGTLPALVSSTPGPATLASGGGVSGSIDTVGATFLGMFVTGTAFDSEVVADCVGSSYSVCGGASSNTWTCTSWSDPNGNPGQMFCYVLSPAVGSTHWFSVTASSCGCVFYVWAFSGLSAYDGDQVTGSTSSNTTFSIGPSAPTGAATVQFTGVTLSSNTTSASINSGFNTAFLQNVDAGVTYGLTVSYLIQSSGSATTPQWITGPNAGSNAMILSFH
jgi:hypothetical protein